MGRGLRITAVAGLVAASVPVLAGTAAAQCTSKRGQPASAMTQEPWPQQKLNFTEVWPLTKGGGVKVAVVDSGVAAHPQINLGQSFDDTGKGIAPCGGHGTMVAGIIAAKDLRQQRVPFVGVAPAVQLMSFKMVVDDTSSSNDTHWLAKALRDAADKGARVINVSSQSPDVPYLKEAVRYAQQKGALIVAAAGNIDQDKKDSEQPLYPAAYPGVLSVGAIDNTGKVTDFTVTKSNVSVLAPGQNVAGTWTGGSYIADSGTSFAAPFVSGTAALVWSYHRNLTAEQVMHRIEVTADGATSAGSGYGTVNPLRAVTAVLPEESGQNAAQPKAGPVTIPTPKHTDPFTRNMSLGLTAGALGLAGLGVAGAFIVPAGRRRNWQPGRKRIPS
jgi:membrane-anchored mycosin MYCP